MILLMLSLSEPMIPGVSEDVSCDPSPNVCLEATDDDLEDDDRFRSPTFFVLFLLLRTSRS